MDHSEMKNLATGEIAGEVVKQRRSQVDILVDLKARQKTIREQARLEEARLKELIKAKEIALKVKEAAAIRKEVEKERRRTDHLKMILGGALVSLIQESGRTEMMNVPVIGVLGFLSKIDWRLVKRPEYLNAGVALLDALEHNDDAKKRAAGAGIKRWMDACHDGGSDIPYISK